MARPCPVTRLAPSPTGWLHVGHARSFLVAWWYARKLNGSVRLRLDDLDTSRVKTEFIDGTLEDLAWLGVDWDGPILFETDRLAQYSDAARKLEASGSAFACICSRGDILATVGAPHSTDPRPPLYPGTCRGTFASVEFAEQTTGKLAGLRFRPPSGRIEFVDLLQGSISQEVSEYCGDFLIVRRDKVPAYHLTVVVDDAFQNVTHVIRGDDLAPSTPRQLCLYRALGQVPPRYIHIPLVVDSHGKRLAKRADSLSLRHLRRAGVSGAALVRWIAHSVGIDTRGNTRPCSSDWIGRFDLHRLGRDPIVVDEARLLQQLRQVS